MNVSAEVLRTHLDYNQWATDRLMAQAAQLSEDERTRGFGTADKSLTQTMAHVYAADDIWLARMEQTVTGPILAASTLAFAFLDREWPVLQRRWKAYAAKLTDESVNDEIHYVALNGTSYTQPVWQLLLHVVNHATHHRGQAAGFLRALGKTPQPLDLVAYYRQLGPWKS